MNKRFILVCALLALAAGHATAASNGIVNLSWNDCGLFGAGNENFACNTNAGTHALVSSFISFVPLDSMNGNEALIELQTSGPTLAPWWQIRIPSDGSSACRNGSLVLDFSFVNGPGQCFDYWNGHAQGGVGFIRDPGQVNRARILVICAIPPEQARPLAPGIETYSFKLLITNAKTVGTGACAGCADGALLVLNSIQCTQNPGVSPTGGTIDKLMETLGAHASFQAGVPTTTRNTTWGGVKSLYR